MVYREILIKVMQLNAYTRDITLINNHFIYYTKCSMHMHYMYSIYYILYIDFILYFYVKFKKKSCMRIKHIIRRNLIIILIYYFFN